MGAEAQPRARVCAVFLRILGLIYLVAFLSLLLQVDVLFGSQGLLPVQQYLDAIRPSTGVLQAPTIFWISGGDTALHVAAIAGIALSCGLIFNVAPRYCLIASWALYLSFVTVGQDFLSFQWDNLLLESASFALFLTPRGLRPRHPAPPHPIAVFLMLWLLFRLHVESGAAKLLSGDATWRNLTALVNYYETAPLPTWIGWYAHQMPIAAHKLCALLSLVMELIMPLFMWGPRRLRVAVFLIFVSMQISIVLTANYGVFNYLTMALCLFLLDDGHLGWLAGRFGVSLQPQVAFAPDRLRTVLLGIVAAVAIPVSTVPFLPFFHMDRLNRELLPVRRILSGFRSLNAYHLFAQMTLVRKEVVIEASADGSRWSAYELRWKPGDPDRPPPVVAPYQPRVDFQLWFLLLGGPQRARYFDNLLRRLFEAPTAMAPLFSRDPFPDTPPTFLRLAIYRYRFTSFDERRATGAWWRRDLLGYSRSLDAALVHSQSREHAGG